MNEGYWFDQEGKQQALKKLRKFLEMSPDAPPNVILLELALKNRRATEQESEQLYLRCYDCIKGCVSTPSGYPPVVGYTDDMLAVLLGD